MAGREITHWAFEDERYEAGVVPPNKKPHAANPAIASELQVGRYWRGVADAERSAYYL